MALATLLAVGAGVGGMLCGVIRGNERLFQRLLHLVAGWYSPDGAISPAGVAIIRRTVELMIWGAAVTAAWASVVACSLRRILSGGVLADAMRVAARSVSPPLSWREGAAVLAAIGAAGAMRLPGLFASLQYDEIFSLQHFASLPTLNIVFAQEGFNNHILNSMLLRLLRHLSSSEAWLRLPVFLAGMASLWLFFRLGRSLGGRLVGWLALALAMVSPYHLWYSTMARGYMLSVCLSLFGLRVLVTAEQPPKRSAL